MQATSATNQRSYVRNRKNEVFVDIRETVNLSAKVNLCYGVMLDGVTDPEIECGWPYLDADVTVWQS